MDDCLTTIRNERTHQRHPFTEQFKIAISWAFNEQLNLINQELFKFTRSIYSDEDFTSWDRTRINFLQLIGKTKKDLD